MDELLKDGRNFRHQTVQGAAHSRYVFGQKPHPAPVDIFYHPECIFGQPVGKGVRLPAQGTGNFPSGCVQQTHRPHRLFLRKIHYRFHHIGARISTGVPDHKRTSCHGGSIRLPDKKLQRFLPYLFCNLPRTFKPADHLTMHLVYTAAAYRIVCVVFQQLFPGEAQKILIVGSTVHHRQSG